MKVTKRPKHVKLEAVKVTTTSLKYICPTCKTWYHGYVSGNVTRFICGCGQELIVDGIIR